MSTTVDGRVVIGFEDLYGGGDADYDDNLFSFRGGISDVPIGVDPAEVVVIDSSVLGDAAGAGSVLGRLAAQTSGAVRTAQPEQVGEAAGMALQDALGKPFPALSASGSGRIGERVLFDASASWHPDGSIVSYGWDLDGDGTVERTTDVPTLEHMYTSAFDGVAAVTTTDSRGRSSLAWASILVSRDGDAIDDVGTSSDVTFEGDGRPAGVCPDAFDPEQLDTDGDGLGDACETDPEPGTDLGSFFPVRRARRAQAPRGQTRLTCRRSAVRRRRRQPCPCGEGRFSWARPLW